MSKNKDNKFIVEQAVNFDKLKWNRKERNFALFWPTITWGIFFIGFVALLMGKTEPDAKLEALIVTGLTFGAPILYFAYKDYLWAFIVIPVIYVSITSYQICMGIAEKPWLPLLVAAFFIIPIKIELYRRKHGLSKPKNTKKDVVIGVILALIFPALWLLSTLWR